MKRGQSLVNKEGRQVALFPYAQLKLTQLMDGPAYHQGTMAIDLGGVAGVRDDVFAPADVRVAFNPNDASHTVVYDSVEKCLWADGTVDYFTMVLKHDNDVSDMHVGDVYKQGEVIGQEGGAGGFAAHVHLGVARGKYTPKTGMVAAFSNLFRKNEKGNFELINEVEPYKVFFINDTKVIADGGYPWKTYIPALLKPSIGVKTKVFIKAKALRYATGQVIPPYYKKGGKRQGPYTIIQDGDLTRRGAPIKKGAWLLGDGLKSWVLKSDVEL